MKTKKKATIFAILAATLYAINVPISKILLKHVDATMMAAFLYLGAGIGMMIYRFSYKAFGEEDKVNPLTKAEAPYVLAMVLLDIAAPIFLMIGISKTTSASVSLLNNFEIVATSLVAFVIFKEVVSKRLWLAIVLVTIASTILTYAGEGDFVFNQGSLYVLAATICWGFENNCTKMISNKSSEEIVVIKGCFSGLGSLLIALLIGEKLPAFKWVAAVLLLGFVSYGLSINFYIRAQKNLGAAKTSAYYSLAPFLGVAFSFLMLGERLDLKFYLAFLLMAISTWLMVKDTITLQHAHAHEHWHSHEHRHGDLVHLHPHAHVHSHWHTHGMDTENHDHETEGYPENHDHRHES